MSRKPESVFIDSVHKHLPDTLYRMKNHNMYNGGIADCWYSGRGGDLWVEYKFIELPKRDATVVDPGLSALQQEWLTQRHAEGRQVAVIVGCKGGGVWFHGVTWDLAYTSSEFRSWVEDRQSLAERIKTLTGE